MHGFLPVLVAQHVANPLRNRYVLMRPLVGRGYLGLDSILFVEQALVRLHEVELAAGGNPLQPIDGGPEGGEQQIDVVRPTTRQLIQAVDTDGRVAEPFDGALVAQADNEGIMALLDQHAHVTQDDCRPPGYAKAGQNEGNLFRPRALYPVLTRQQRFPVAIVVLEVQLVVARMQTQVGQHVLYGLEAGSVEGQTSP